MLYKPRKLKQKFCENVRVFYHLDSFTPMIFFVFFSRIVNEFFNYINFYFVLLFHIF